MGYQLLIGADVGAWLDKLRADHPEIASQVTQALEVLQARGPRAGPPLLVPVDYDPGNRVPRPSSTTPTSAGWRSATDFAGRSARSRYCARAWKTTWTTP